MLALRFFQLGMLSSAFKLNVSGNGETSQDYCTHCPTRPDEESVLEIVPPTELCEDSTYWGAVLPESFVSEVFIVGTHKWQARTVAACQLGSWSHVLFPFLIGSAGATKIGFRASAKLADVGAIPSSRERLKTCNIIFPLPIEPRDCIYRWEDHRDGVRDLDDGHDIREHLENVFAGEFVLPDHKPADLCAGNNMIGENDADVILALEQMATVIKHSKALDFEEAVDLMMIGLQKYGLTREAIAHELKLNVASPPMKDLFSVIRAKMVSAAR